MTQLGRSSNDQNFNNSCVFWHYEITMSKTWQVGKSQYSSSISHSNSNCQTWAPRCCTLAVMINVLFLISSYVLMWFSIVHHYLCQCKVKYEYHGHEKAQHVNLFFILMLANQKKE
jgi:hypothetical protein